ncbi:MAG TPA: SRPBCC family protein, partial [Polyangiaceae bacterium]|nr:SRPBCC family protein [Polyangiaceae bacterium]
MADIFRIARSATIAAPPERIAPYIQDFRAWEKWSPYEKLDPRMKKTFSGAERGVGASYAWEGNSKAGAGSMTITA